MEANHEVVGICDTSTEHLSSSGSEEVLKTMSREEKVDENTMKYVKCTFPRPNDETDTLELPEELVSDPDLFHDVLSKKTWDDFLNDDQKARLLKLLPEKVTGSNESTDSFLSNFFNVGNTSMYFLHPLVDFQRKLQAGYYDAICANEIRQLKVCARVHYEHRLREYYGRILKKLLINRRKLLEAAASVPEGGLFNYDWKTDFMDNLQRQRGVAQMDDDASPVYQRSSKRARLMIMDCKVRAGEQQTLSSDDEDFAGPSTTATTSKVGAGGGQVGSMGTLHIQGHHRHLGHFTGDTTRNSNVRSTLAKQNDVDFDLHEPIGALDFKDLLKEYRQLRRLHPEHPSLEYDDIELDDVVDRCGTELKLLAQKWGVYKKQEQADSMESVNILAKNNQPVLNSGRKTTVGKQHGKTGHVTSKDK